MPKGTWLEKYEMGIGDLELFENSRQPAYVDSNVYLNGAGHYEREEHFAEGAHHWACSSPERRRIIILRFLFFFFLLVCPFCPFMII